MTSFVGPQALFAVLMTKHRGKLAVLKELFLVLTCLKPAVEIWRLAHGAKQDPGAPMDPKAAMMAGKVAERVLESIPAAILQTITLLEYANARSAWAVASIVIACVATAFVATTIAFNKDTDPEGRHKYPQFNGCADCPFPPAPAVRSVRTLAHSVRMAAKLHSRAARYMGDTAASKARCFCVLFVVHLAQILLRTATLSLLAATRGWLAAVYLVGDFVVLVAYKAVRRDLVNWVPTSGVPLSLLWRFVVKVFTDSTSCAHLRHPCELGGLYYCLNIFLGQALPPFSACLESWPCVRGLILFYRAGRGVRVGRAVCGLLRRRGQARGRHALRLRLHAHGGLDRLVWRAAGDDRAQVRAHLLLRADRRRVCDEPLPRQRRQ